MHKLGCPCNNNPYADCQCAAMEQREHTEQLRQYNTNAPTVEQVNQLQAQLDKMHAALIAAEKYIAGVNADWPKGMDDDRDELLVKISESKN